MFEEVTIEYSLGSSKLVNKIPKSLKSLCPRIYTESDIKVSFPVKDKVMSHHSDFLKKTPSELPNQ